MLELAAASVCLLTLTVGWCLPTPDRPFIKLFFELLDYVRSFLFCLIQVLISEIRKPRKKSKKRSKSVCLECLYNEALSNYYKGLDVPIEPFVHSEFRTENEAKNSDLGSDDSVINSCTESTKMFSEDEVLEIKRQIFQKHLARIRSLTETHDKTINELNAEHQQDLIDLQLEHDEKISQIEKQWKSTLRDVEHELRRRLSELQAEINRLTRPDPQRFDKEKFRQVQLMRGAGMSRNQIFQRVLGRKMEGKSAPAAQKDYDELIEKFGGDWIREMASYDLDPGKIVDVIWGNFRNASTKKEYIAKVQAVIDAKALEPNNVIQMHRVG